MPACMNTQNDNTVYVTLLYMHDITLYIELAGNLYIGKLTAHIPDYKNKNCEHKNIEIHTGNHTVKPVNPDT